MEQATWLSEIQQLSNGSIEAFNAVFIKFTEIIDQQNQKNQSLRDELVTAHNNMMNTDDELAKVYNDMIAVIKELSATKEAFEQANERLKQANERLNQEIQKAKELQTELVAVKESEAVFKGDVEKLRKNVKDNEEAFEQSNERLKERINFLENEIKDIQSGIILSDDNANHRGLSDEIKKLIRQHRENGDSYREIAEKENVGLGTAHKYGKQEMPSQPKQPELPKRRTPKISSEPKLPEKEGAELLLRIEEETGLSLALLNSLGKDLKDIGEIKTMEKHTDPKYTGLGVEDTEACKATYKRAIDLLKPII
jgi:transposase